MSQEVNKEWTVEVLTELVENKPRIIRVDRSDNEISRNGKVEYNLRPVLIVYNTNQDHIRKTKVLTKYLI